MTKKAKARIFFLLDRDSVNATPTDAVLDMLRYDRAVVEGNPPAGFYLLSIEDGYAGPNVDRWRSFGLTVRRVARGDAERYAMIDWAREHAPVAR